MQLHPSATVNPIAGSVQASKEPTSLEISLDQMDEQLSRFFNNMNRLDQLAERLKQSGQDIKEDGKPSITPPLPADHCGRLVFLLDMFSHINSRLECTVNYLGRAI